MKQKRPSFQFYPADFLADENVKLMSNRAIGCYIKLLCYCWRQGSMPASIKDIAKLCDERPDVMKKIWIDLKSCFVTSETETDRLFHPRLLSEKNKQDSFKKERSESGKKGAEARWNKDSLQNKPAGSAIQQIDGSAIQEPIAQPIAEPIAKNSFSSSFSSSLKIKEKDSPDISNQDLNLVGRSCETTNNKKTSRGTRLPADWNIPHDWVQWALNEKQQWTNHDVLRVAENFKDFWVAKSGSGATKLDWQATWRVWVRNQNLTTSRAEKFDPMAYAAQREREFQRAFDDNVIDVTPQRPLLG